MVSLFEAQRPSRWDMHTPGPRLVQSLSPVQAPQVFADEQTGFAFGQSVLTAHSTQAPLGPQLGLLGTSVEHMADEACPTPHPTQVPAPEQNGVVDDDEQSASLPHSTQAPLAPQTGFAPFRAMQAPWPAWLQGTQVFCAPQKGAVGSLQSLLVSHATQAPLVAQTAFVWSRVPHAFLSTPAPLQSTHTLPLQKSLSAVLQSPSTLHPTH